MVMSKYAVDDFFTSTTESFAWMKKIELDELELHVNHLPTTPRFKTTPREQQFVCLYIGACLPNFQFFLDMGAGKTKLCLDLIQYHKDTGEVKNALVLVPRIINIGEWEEQAEEHSFLKPSLVLGDTMEEKWEKLFQGDFAVVDYHNFHLLLSSRVKGKGLERNDKRIRAVQKHFQFIGFDEIHKSGGHGSKRFRLFKSATAMAPLRFGFTGTPFGRDPMALWSEFYLIDRGETLAPTKTAFQQYFFKEEMGYWGNSWVFDKSRTRELYHRLQHRSIRYEESELTALPPIQPIPRHLSFTQEQRQHYLNALEGIIAAEGDPTKADAPFVRLRQICSGYLDWNDEEGRHHVEFSQNPKLEALMATIDALPPEEKIVVFCEYTSTGRLITNALTKEKIKHSWLYGGSKKPLEIVAGFKRDPKVRVLVANSESGGTGINLQAVCRYVVFFESPVSPTTRRQAVKRVHRPGQTRKCFIIDLIMRRSIDVRVLKFVEEGRALSAALIDGRREKNLLMAD